MATDIEICSNALLLIGDTAISSFSDSGAGAEAANDFYQETKNEVLSYHPWTFAMKEVAYEYNTWDSSTTYVATTDYVINDDIFYVCILGHSNQEPPNATYWTALTKPDSLKDYKYVYNVPSDMERLWYILPKGTNYEILGSTIQTNSNKILFGYIYDVAEASLPDWFTVALQYKLASKFAMIVTESVSLANKMDEMYQYHVLKATNIDSQSKPNIPIIDRPFTNARYGGGY